MDNTLGIKLWEWVKFKVYFLNRHIFISITSIWAWSYDGNARHYSSKSRLQQQQERVQLDMFEDNGHRND